MSEQKIVAIIKDLEQKRIAIINEHEIKKNNLIKKIPRLGEIDRLISSLTYKSIREAISSKKNDIILSNLKMNIERLTSERDSIIKKANLDFDYFEPDWSCKLCKDTGYVNDKKCSCLINNIINMRYKDSNLYALLKYQNFDNFDLNLYSNFSEKDKSPRYYANLNYTFSLDFCNNFTTKYTNLFITGKSGIGKTFLCSCIAKNLIDKGFSVIYVTCYNLIEKYNQIKFNKSSESISDYIDCDLLIIDDLGSENRTEYNTSILFHIINDRINERKPIVISSNFSLGNLQKEYGDRIASRISSKQFAKLVFIGTDIRQKK